MYSSLSYLEKWTQESCVKVSKRVDRWCCAEDLQEGPCGLKSKLPLLFHSPHSKDPLQHRLLDGKVLGML